ncbi:hypothetical protein GBAR_LOCUS7101, partial [Geodia barretti]
IAAVLLYSNRWGFLLRRGTRSDLAVRGVAGPNTYSSRATACAAGRTENESTICTQSASIQCERSA